MADMSFFEALPVGGSNRTGTWNIWVCDQDGSNELQLAFFEDGSAAGPSWSPDSRQIVFGRNHDEGVDIFLVNSEGGQPRRITQESSFDGLPSWSRDGEWIYFRSNRSGEYQVWKVSPRGGKAQRVTEEGGLRALEAFDQQYLYFQKGAGYDRSIWRMPVSGGEETVVVEDEFVSNDWGLTRAPGLASGSTTEKMPDFNTSDAYYTPYYTPNPVPARVSADRSRCSSFSGG